MLYSIPDYGGYVWLSGMIAKYFEVVSLVMYILIAGKFKMAGITHDQLHMTLIACLATTDRLS